MNEGKVLGNLSRLINRSAASRRSKLSKIKEKLKLVKASSCRKMQQSTKR